MTSVVIAGGGIGGLAAALALARAGLDVEVFERAGAPGETGAGVQLSPNATRILFGWGLEAALRQAAFEPQAVEIRDRADGRRLLRTPLGADAVERWGAPYLQLHRADLHAILFQAARAADARVRFGGAVEAVSVAEAAVTFTAGGQARTVDALVGADGVRSGVRAALFGARAARFTGQVAWRGVAKANRLPSSLVAPAATVFTSARGHAVLYYLRGGALVNFAGFSEASAWREESWTVRAEPGELSRAFAGWPAPVGAVVASIEAEGGGWRFAVHDRAPLARWSVGRAVLLGDAAHPMTPFLAQGAAMAIEDAAALARHLAAAPSDPASALGAYASERAPRTRRVQRWADRNGRLFHLPGPLRRAAFAVARSLPGGPAAQLDWLYGKAAVRASDGLQFHGSRATPPVRRA